MRDKFLTIVILLAAIFSIYFVKMYFSEYNLKKSIAACVLGQKRTSDSFNLEKVDENIMIENGFVKKGHLPVKVLGNVKTRGVFVFLMYVLCFVFEGVLKMTRGII